MQIYLTSSVACSHICVAFVIQENAMIALSTACTRNITLGKVSDCTNARTPASDQIL